MGFVEGDEVEVEEGLFVRASPCIQSHYSTQGLLATHGPTLREFRATHCTGLGDETIAALFTACRSGREAPRLEILDLSFMTGNPTAFAHRQTKANVSYVCDIITSNSSTQLLVLTHEKSVCFDSSAREGMHLKSWVVKFICPLIQSSIYLSIYLFI